MPRFSPWLAAVFALAFLAGCAEQEPADDAEMEMPASEAPAAETGLTMEDLGGTWDGTTYMESGDTVRYTMTVRPDEDSWMVDLPDRDPMPMRVVVMSGDSVVGELGPYESILREGVTVTVRTVSRLQDGRMVGTMEARYTGADADTVVMGRMEATRGM